jgi:EAL domain-containing protein (putative c-di-GMP-specific phosphodiesterase class I)
MDDFGTGYSSLSSLRAFPFDKIKIDREFVEDLGKRKQAAMIVRSVLGLGKSLEVPVSAEGVETREQTSRFSIPWIARKFRATISGVRHRLGGFVQR